MKLVDILARELKVWPQGFDDVGQADMGSLHLPGLGRHVRHTNESYTKAEDWFAAIVTRAQWQAAVDALRQESFQLPKWTGEGLPPVGATVEIHRGKWNIRIDSECFLGIPVTVAAVFKMSNGTEMVAVDGGPSIGCEVFRAECVKPVRTPEQIAAEAKGRAVTDMMVVVTSRSLRGKGGTAQLEALYDAGFRRFEIVEGE